MPPGSIALASSVNAQLGIGETPYSCAKAALHPLAMNLGVHYGPQGLNANAVAIGTVVRLSLSAASSDSTKRQAEIVNLCSMRTQSV